MGTDFPGKRTGPRPVALRRRGRNLGPERGTVGGENVRKCAGLTPDTLCHPIPSMGWASLGVV